MNKSKYNVVVGGSVQRTYLEGDLITRGVQIDRSYQNVLPAVRFNYDFSNTRHLRLDYETSVQEPTIQQLQPVIDNSDPLNLYVGNPQLRPTYSQSWRLNFTTFDPATFISFFSFVNVDYTTNAITNAQYIDSNLVRTTTPVNVDNSMSVSGNAQFSFPIQKLKSRFSLGGDYRNQRSINLLNETANTIHQQTLGGTARYNYRYNDIFDLSLSADLDHQLTSYEFNQPDQTFINSTYTAESNLTLLKNYQVSTSFEYLEYENRSTNYSQAIPLLNLSVSRFVLKNKAGELKLAVNNLLDKALGISQTASINYLERQTTNSLGRYFMLSFTYALNKQLNPMGMRRGGGMIRVMRPGG
jgi:outer membrane receptor protein involved in Fe transport